MFLPGEFHGRRSLEGCSSWGRRESDTTEWLTHIHTHSCTTSLSLSPCLIYSWSCYGKLICVHWVNYSIHLLIYCLLCVRYYLTSMEDLQHTFFCFWLWLRNQRFECFVPIPILPFLCLCPRPLCLQSFSLSLYSPLTNQSTKTFAITQESKIPSWRFPSWRRSKDFLPEEGNGHPLQNSCLGNPMDRVAWWAEVHRVMQSWTRLKQVSSKSPCISSPHTTSASIQRRSVNVLL